MDNLFLIKNMKNLDLLNYCKENKENFLDSAYIFLEKDMNLDKYIEKTKKIKNKLIAIKEICDKKSSEMVLNELFNTLIFDIKEYASYSEFACFINACDSNIDEVSNNRNLLEEITRIYIEKRDLNEIVPSEWIQALIDKGSSRKKGKVGEKKLILVLERDKYILTKKYDEFIKNEKSIAQFSKGGDFCLKKIKDNFGISIGKKTQNKTLDLIIKNSSDIYFLEAKHMSTKGGGQDKQVKEIIDLIKNKPTKNNYHFVSYLDGIYSNILLEIGDKKVSTKKQNKLKNQYKDIIKALNKNSNNYWINTAGFKKLFEIV